MRETFIEGWNLNELILFKNSIKNYGNDIFSAWSISL